MEVLTITSRNRKMGHDGRLTMNFDPLKSEQARLNTFHTTESPWPVTYITPLSCAKAGFFFLKDGDKVQCAFCRGVAGEWEEGDVPVTEHKKHFPRCPFICNLPVGNIPIGQEEAVASVTDTSNDSYGYDVCGPFEIIGNGNSFTNSEVHVRGALPIAGDQEDLATSLAIRMGSGPTRKNLVTVQSRLKTFSDWPRTTGQSAEMMAEAGFFYIGIHDHVKCFYCDGGLRNWEECDDPWFEHARWFANCPYILLNKGQDYIKQVVESKPPLAITSESKGSSSESDDESTTSSSSLKEPKQDAVLNPPSTSEYKNCRNSESDDESMTSSSSLINCNPPDTAEPPSPSTSDAENSESSDEDITKENNLMAVKDSRKLAEPISQITGTSECNNIKGEGFNLEEELRKMKEARQCKICMDNEVGVVFLPCGHLVSCVRCATALSNCALCRQPIKAVVRTYLS